MNIAKAEIKSNLCLFSEVEEEKSCLAMVSSKDNEIGIPLCSAGLIIRGCLKIAAKVLTSLASLIRM